jgi:hypothetical protein
VQAVLQAHAHIPAKGEGAASGYGILTTQGLNAIIVSTTHKGVLDSEDQRNANDPRWHNHYLYLVTQVSGPCGTDPQVTSITFQPPGDVLVCKDKAIMSNLPDMFTRTNASNGNPLMLNPGTNVHNVVSFELKSLSDGNVCMLDIQPAKK